MSDEPEAPNTFLTGTEEQAPIQRDVNGPKIGLADAQLTDCPTPSVVPIDPAKVEGRKLKKIDSSFFKSLAANNFKSRHTKGSVIKAKPVNMWHQESGPSFTKTIFNPKTKFMDRLDSTFQNTSDNH